jgi:hypothetical protein
LSVSGFLPQALDLMRWYWRPRRRRRHRRSSRPRQHQHGLACRGGGRPRPRHGDFHKNFHVGLLDRRETLRRLRHLFLIEKRGVRFRCDCIRSSGDGCRLQRCRETLRRLRHLLRVEKGCARFRRDCIRSSGDGCRLQRRRETLRRLRHLPRVENGCARFRRDCVRDSLRNGCCFRDRAAAPSSQAVSIAPSLDQFGRYRSYTRALSPVAAR